MSKSVRSNKLIMLCLVIILIVLILVSLALGKYPVEPHQVFGILVSKICNIDKFWTDSMETIFLNVRLPRIVLACLVGGALAAAGASYQYIFLNPMASPDILGASSGAAFGAALALFLYKSGREVTVSAFIFSLITVLLVYLISERTKGNKVLGLILSGIMVSSLFSSGTSFIKLVADPNDQLPAITYWLMGSLSGAKTADIKFAIIPMLIGIVPLILISWQINILTVGEDEARTMGINTKRIRFITIVCATLLTSASVAVSGMIGWVGLVIPHLSRRLVGNNFVYLLPTSAMFGASFLLLVDNVSRNLWTSEIPIGILTSFIGVPFFIYLITKGGINMILEVKNLSYFYKERNVLNQISFTVEGSQLLCILGPNGAGKSTMFKCILQLLKGYKGEILLDGKNLKDYKIKNLARKIAYIPQSHNPVFSYSVAEMVLMGTTSQISPMSKPTKKQLQTVEESLDKIGISYLKDRSFVNLSGGERQLVLIARALAQNAKILIMDEPTSDLDYGNQIRVLNTAKELTKDGYIIIQSTHNPDQAFLYADRVLALYNHEILAFGVPKYIINSGLIKKLYNVDVELNSLYDDKIRICIPKSVTI